MWPDPDPTDHHARSVIGLIADEDEIPERPHALAIGIPENALPERRRRQGIGLRSGVRTDAPTVLNDQAAASRGYVTRPIAGPSDSGIRRTFRRQRQRGQPAAGAPAS